MVDGWRMVVRWLELTWGVGMVSRVARLTTVALAVTAGALIGAAPCFAQFTGGGGSSVNNINSAVQKNLRGAQGAARPEAQPPVLPGTKGPSEVAEPSAAARELSPTDALFDAINRGDLAAAREAVNRGADLDGHNLLGLTPVDLSVDLGRNDISFALLSMRGEYGSPGPSGSGGSNRASGLNGDARPEAIAPRAVGRVRLVRTSADPADEPEIASRRYSSGNGGAPIPAAGFLGFDGARSGR